MRATTARLDHEMKLEMMPDTAMRGYVFIRSGHLFRALDDETHASLSKVASAGLLEKFIVSRKMVATRFVEEPALLEKLEREHPGYSHFLEHEILPSITFPYEWTVSMLADAAMLTLDLQLALLDGGFSLKEASAYNVQFREGRPIFIDLGTIEKPRRCDLWSGLGQFQRHFLFPLLLTCHRGWDLRSYFLANLDGLGPQQVAANFRGLSRWSPALVRDLALANLGEGDDLTATVEEAPPNLDSGKQITELQRLRSRIEALAREFNPRIESDETGDLGAIKGKMIDLFLREIRPSTVLDAACGTGELAYTAAATGATVVAIDADGACVDQLYRRLKTKPAKITPMVLDLANPSPAIGHLNSERASFLDRTAANCVVAMDSLPHLLTRSKLTIEEIRDLLDNLACRWLVLEYVPVGCCTLETCISAISSVFDLRTQEPIGTSGRTMLFFERSPS